jgi:hypothetical protein
MPGSNEIRAELIEAGGEILSVIHKLINSVWNKEELLLWDITAISFIQNVIEYPPF